MTIIRATGSSERELRAQLATLRIHVNVTHREREVAVRDAVTTHNTIVARARGLVESGDATSVEAQAPSTYGSSMPGPTPSAEPQVVTVATSNVSVTLSNLELVGALTLELALAGASVHIDWNLTDATRREGERACRREAVLRAREIADDYAEALGTTIVAVASIDDGEPARGGVPMFAMRAGAFDESMSTPDVTVPTLTVSATVRGTYETA